MATTSQNPLKEEHSLAQIELTNSTFELTREFTAIWNLWPYHGGTWSSLGKVGALVTLVTYKTINYSEQYIYPYIINTRVTAWSCQLENQCRVQCLNQELKSNFGYPRDVCSSTGVDRQLERLKMENNVDLAFQTINQVKSGLKQ